MVSTVREFQYLLGISVVLLGTLAANGESREKKAVSHRQVATVARKPCSVRFGGSALPEPCDRVGEMPATAEPMRIIGKLPTAQSPR